MSEIKAIEKLRSIWKQLPAPTHSDELLLADMDACIKAIEVEIAANYMRLPVDADGVPIHVGDKLYVNEHEFVANGVMFYHNTWRVVTDFAVFDDDGYQMRWAKDCRHVKPRTLEDIVQDAIQYGYSHGKAGMDVSEQRDKYADEIRELLGEPKEV